MVGDFQFQPYSDAFARAPYAVYKVMRERHPIYYHAPWDTWIFSRYADIKTLVMDERLGRVMDHVSTEAEVRCFKAKHHWSAAPMHSRYVKFSILDSEGVVHERLRRSVFALFTAQGVAGLHDTIKAIVDHQLERIESCDEIDFIEDFIAPVPGLVIGAVIGVPAEERPQLRHWSERIVQFFEPERTAAHRELAEQATIDFVSYLEGLIAKRRQKPAADLLSAMIAWRDAAGGLTEVELISTVMTILMAGHGSTIDASANGMLALLQHPQQMQALRDDPGLIATAVPEMLRYDAPLPYFHRYVLQDMEYRGRQFKKGMTLGFLYASANRDAHYFTAADHFDIRRHPNRHLAFGGGVHHCLGNQLARLNMTIIFTRLLQKFPMLELNAAASDLHYHPGCARRGLLALPVRLTAYIHRQN